MAVIQCKMCGNTVEYHAGETTGVCSACSTVQTLPVSGEERKTNLYNAANHYRRIGEFDKAAQICEQIFLEFEPEAEIYWHTALCRYGICYAEDTITQTFLPTISLLQTDSFESDKSYLSALESADAQQKPLYQAQAKAITRLQRAMLERAAQEKPVDVFISFQATDAQGAKTADSVIADYLSRHLSWNNIHAFLSQGIFTQQNLQNGEEKTFAALQSAKVMIAIGTQSSCFTEAQPQNEWKRFLKLSSQNSDKHFLAAVVDINPQDLPEEFSFLPIQQLTETGAMQKLVYAVCKTIRPGEKVINSASNTQPLSECVQMFLQAENWKQADAYADKILAQEPKNAEAYLNKLLAQLQLHKKEELAYTDLTFDNSYYFRSALWFADETFANELNSYVKAKETNQYAKLYNKALTEMQNASSEQTFKTAASLFEYISTFEDSAALAKVCYEKAEECRKDDIYYFAKSKMENGAEHNYEIAIKELESIRGWKDADELLAQCYEKKHAFEKQMAQEIEAARKQLEEQRLLEAKKEARKRKIIITTILTSVTIFFTAVFFLSRVLPERQYKSALAAIGSGNYVEGYETLIALENYKDSAQKAGDIFEQYKAQKLKVAAIGDTVFFGSYEQDSYEKNGAEDIEWLVLDKQDDRLFLISKYGLDHQPYHKTAADITWQNCTMRKWLNKTFYQTAFTEEQQAQILDTELQPDQNPEYDTIYGKATVDKIFLLSAGEAKQYFSSDADRVCLPTKYAIVQGASIADSNKTDDKTCWWFLRTAGGEQSFAAFVHFNGDIRYLGGGVHSIISATRPAMWITIK